MGDAPNQPLVSLSMMQQSQSCCQQGRAADNVVVTRLPANGTAGRRLLPEGSALLVPWLVPLLDIVAVSAVKPQSGDDEHTFDPAKDLMKTVENVAVAVTVALFAENNVERWKISLLRVNNGMRRVHPPSRHGLMCSVVFGTVSYTNAQKG